MWRKFKLRLATRGLTVLIALIGIIAYLSIREEERTMLEIRESNQLIENLDHFLLALREFQKDTRTYVITRANQDLHSYERSRRNALDMRDQLRSNPAANDLIDWLNLDTMLHRKISVSDSIVRFVQSGDFEEAERLIALGRGTFIQRAESMVMAASNHTSRRLSQLTSKRTRYVHALMVLLPLGTLATALIAALVNRVMLLNSQKQFEQALRLERVNKQLSERENYFRKLIEYSHDVIAVIDQAGGLTFISPSIGRLLGYPPAQLIASPKLISVHPDDIRPSRRLLATVRDAPDVVQTGKARVKSKEAEWRTVEFAVRNSLDDPSVRGLIVNARDVTDQEKLQAQLLQSQKMDAIGRLAGGIAHDFNNLITVIKANLGFATQQLPQDHPVLEDLETVEHAADRAASLTRQMLIFSRKEEMRPVSIDACEIVRQFERLIRRVIGEDIEVRLDLPAEPHLVRADPSRLEQVLMNLAVNARDAMPNGGVVSIAVSSAFIDGAWPSGQHLAAGYYVVITVADNGVGMSAEVQSRVFEPFFTTKEVGKGTGLGLATAYAIIKQSGGEIHVYSEPGLGTTFRIFLPQLDRLDASATGPAGAIQFNYGGNERILVVEDEDALRALVCRALRMHGYTVAEASSGDEALRILENDAAFALMISDAIMPGMHGLQLCDIAHDKWPTMKLILMSGYNDREFKPTADITSLEKPFSIPQLLHTIRTTLDKTAI